MMKKRLSYILALTILGSACTSESLSPVEGPAVLSFSPEGTAPFADTKAGNFPASSELLTFTTGKDTLYLTSFSEDNLSPVATKAAPTSDFAATYGSTGFGVIAYTWSDPSSKALYPSIWDYASSGALQAVKGDSWWHIASRELHWPMKNESISFFGYAPFGSSAVTLDYSSPGEPKISDFSVSSDYSSQTDLLVARTGPMSDNPSFVYLQKNGAIQLPFYHALTQLVFRVETGLTLKKVEVEGVYSKGTYNLESQSWTLSGAADFSVSVDGIATTSSGGFNVSNAEYSLLMMPQTLLSSAKVKITFTDADDVSHTVTGDIAGESWSQGKKVTYTISSRKFSYVFSVLGESVDEDGIPQINLPEYSTPASEHAFSVDSYKSDGYKYPQAPVDWQVEGWYSDKGCTSSASAPSWLSGIPALAVSQAGGASVSNAFSSTINSTGGTSTNLADIVNGRIQANPAKGTSSNPWNLSNMYQGNNSIVETANCYIVNAAGWYKIPLVMGNGIVNNHFNTSAYTTTLPAGTINIYRVMKDYVDEDVVDPRIGFNTNHGTPTSAKIIWEDTDGLIAATSYVLDNAPYEEDGFWWLKFEVPAASIVQGNAIIAVYDDTDSIMWSWHIWITDYDPYYKENYDAAFSDTDGHTTYFMDRNLGWVYTDASTGTIYPKQVVYLRLKQAESGNYAVLKITKAQREDFTVRGFSPFYQWGRKDAMIPASVGGSTTKKTVWGTIGAGTNTQPLSESGNDQKMSWAIQNPDKFILGTRGWNKDLGTGPTTTLNRWNINSTGSSNWHVVTKTIYDPCPASFHVPTPYDGHMLTFASLGSWDNGRFITDDGGRTIFFPVEGLLNGGANSSFANIAYGRFWTESSGGHSSYRFTITNDANPKIWETSDGDHRHGQSIRPVED